MVIKKIREFNRAKEVIRDLVKDVILLKEESQQLSKQIEELKRDRKKDKEEIKELQSAVVELRDAIEKNTGKTIDFASAWSEAINGAKESE